MQYLFKLVALSVTLNFCGQGATRAATTNAITFGETASGMILVGETNFYSFTATSNEVVTVLLTATTAVGPLVELRGPQGNVLTTGVDVGGANLSSFVSAFTLPTNGTYLLLVRDNVGNNTFNYNMTLIKNPGPNPADDGGTILPGQTVTNSLPVGGDMDVYAFTGTAGETVTVLLTATTAVGPLVELRGPQGNVLTTGVDVGGVNLSSFVSAFTLPTNGTYLLLVRDNVGNNTFNYNMTLIKNPGPNPADDGGTILPGQTVTNSLPVGGDMDVYAFTGTAGETVTVLLTATTAVGPLVELRGPQGNVLTTGVDVGGANLSSFVSAFTLPTNGTYLLLVRDNVGNNTFNYNMTLIKNPGPNPADDGGTILPGQTVTNSLPVGGDMDVYAFTGTAGETVTVLLTATTAVGPLVELRGPQGNVLTTGVDVGGVNLSSFVSAFTLPTNGTYLLLVRDNVGNNTFNYNMTLIKNPGPNPADDGGTILPGQTVTNSLPVGGDMDVYAFTGTAGETVTVLLTATTAVGPLVELRGPQGNVLTTGVDVGGVNLSSFVSAFTLPTNGTYLLLVRDNVGNNTFNYNMTLIKNPGPNPADDGGTILPGQTVTNSLAAIADMDAYTFRAIAGDSIALLLNVSSGGAVSPMLELHAPDGTVVKTSSSASSARIDVCVQQTGNFLALVRDNVGNNTFGFQLSFSQSPIVPPSSGLTQYLAIFQCTNRVTVRWETNAVGFRLESSRVLPATNWMQESQLPDIIADHFYFTETATNKAKFYRLTCPNCPAALGSP